jgi:hypothetical protein
MHISLKELHLKWNRLRADSIDFLTVHLYARWGGERDLTGLV